MHKNKSLCIVEGCGQISHTSTAMVSIKVAQEYMDIPVSGAEKEGSDSEPQSLSLCSSQYQHMYR